MKGMKGIKAKKLRKLGRKVIGISQIPSNIREIPKIIKSESYYPDKERKSNLNMFFDNLMWIIKNKEANYSYSFYGLDVKNLRDSASFLSKADLMKERNYGNSGEKYGLSYSYGCLLKDKYKFSNYLSHVIGEDKVAPVIAIYSNEEVYLLNEKIYISLDKFLKRDMKVFCKIIDGESGEDIFLFEKKDNNYYLNNNLSNLLEVKTRIGRSKFIFQNVIQQHEALNKLNDSTVNSIRVITVRGLSGKIGVLTAYLRLGTVKDSVVDNNAAGGLGVSVDDNGVLGKYGFYISSFGTKAEKHPISNAVFEGYQLPYWNEVKDLVEKAHKQFYHMQSIGWDVAITPNGPILIEGNDKWETTMPQGVGGGLKEKWYRLKNS